MHLNSGPPATGAFWKLWDLLDMGVAGRSRALGVGPEGCRLLALLAKLSIALSGT